MKKNFIFLKEKKDKNGSQQEHFGDHCCCLAAGWDLVLIYTPQKTTQTNGH